MARLLMLVFIYFCAFQANAFRDPFDSKARILIGDPLRKMAVEDLIFLGTVTEKGSIIAFVSDGNNNVYRIIPFQKLGYLGDKVIRIFKEGVLVGSGQRLYVIK